VSEKIIPAQTEQANNTRRNRYIAIGGERFTVAQLARLHGINYFTLISRLDSGVNPLDAIHGGPK
jgi:hypothetical protein